ncbi:MAG: DUF1799 domain-containing protein [Sporomusaceae bacterium]|nr:DUF1799 domain-containing protein [Sporomusaceae bacterium]
MNVWQWVVDKSEYCRACKDLEDTDQTDCDECEYKSPGVWWENKTAWQLWIAVRTQWRTGIIGAAGMMTPCPTGLDYPAVYATAKILEIDVTPALFHKLQALEIFELKRVKEGANSGGE